MNWDLSTIIDPKVLYLDFSDTIYPAYTTNIPTYLEPCDIDLTVEMDGKALVPAVITEVVQEKTSDRFRIELGQLLKSNNEVETQYTIRLTAREGTRWLANVDFELIIRDRCRDEVVTLDIS